MSNDKDQENYVNSLYYLGFEATRSIWRELFTEEDGRNRFYSGEDVAKIKERIDEFKKYLKNSLKELEKSYEDKKRNFLMLLKEVNRDFMYGIISAKDQQSLLRYEVSDLKDLFLNIYEIKLKLEIADEFEKMLDHYNESKVKMSENFFYTLLEKAATKVIEKYSVNEKEKTNRDVYMNKLLIPLIVSSTLIFGAYYFGFKNSSMFFLTSEYFIPILIISFLSSFLLVYFLFKRNQK
jgi:REP element-mobilizing transposase RayT